MTERANRRLAAILAADIAGYSRLVQADEEGTINAYQTMRDTLIEPCISNHDGRIANTAGDSLLVEFRSAVDAARCALALQSVLAEANSSREPESRIELRIGLNVGDVIGDGADLLGDGVNLAARVEQLADPGGILATRTVADHVQGRSGFVLQSAGQHRVKNMAEPVEVFRILAAETGDAPAPRSRFRLAGWAIPAVLVLILAAAAAYWFRAPNPAMTPAQEDRMAFPLPDKPSVAVLPFKTFSEQTVFLADGVTDDLITDLSKVSGLFVISGNTSFSLRDAEMDVAGFSEALGVRFVVEGGVRRTSDDLRVNARLIDATTGHLVWADRYEGEVGDIFQMQMQLAIAVTEALGITVPDNEMSEIKRMDTQTVEAREAFQRGWELFSRFNEGDNLASIPHFERAVELDPDYGRAYGALAMAHLRHHTFHHWDRFVEPGGKMHVSPFFDNLRLAAQHETSLIHVLRAMMLLNLVDWMQVDSGNGADEAQVEAAKAIALLPSDPEAHLTMGWALIASGEPEEGASFVKAAMRLDPAYPSHYVLFEAAAQIALADLPAAERALQSGLARDPEANELRPVLASVLAQQGKRTQAHAVVAEWQAGKDPADLPTAVERYFFIVRWTGEHTVLNLQIQDGLRLAAIPAEVTVQTLREELAQSDPQGKLSATRMLGLFGADAVDAVPDLIDALASESSVLRRSAAIALGRIGPAAKASVPALEALVGESIVGAHAQRALDQIRVQ